MASAAPQSTNKIKLHNFPVDLRWTQKTPKPHPSATSDQVEDPAPPADDDVVAGRGNSQKTVKKGKEGGGDSSNGKVSGKKVSARLRGAASASAVAVGSGGGGSERQRRVAEDKRKIWISLTKEEIEEDIYSMTGARPRRPRKRPRSVQKLLDNVFPAMNLVGMSAEAYRVQESMYQR